MGERDRCGEQPAWYQEAEWLRGHDNINEAKRVLDEAMEAGARDERIRELFNQLATGFGSPAASKDLKPVMRDTLL